MKTVVKPSARETAKRLITRIPVHGGQRSHRVVSLLYHSVHPTKPFASVTPAEFARHLAWLQEHCRVVPFADLVNQTAVSNGRPVVAITFDDGFADNHEYALPILAEKGIPATFFVTTGLVMGSPAVIDRFARLWGGTDDDVRGLTWTQISEMQAEGMTIGSHTTTHPNLPSLDAATARRELLLSKHILEDRLGTRITTFAYPFGKPKHNVNLATRDLVRQAGFSVAATVNYRALQLGEERLDRPAVGDVAADEAKARVLGDLFEVLEAAGRGIDRNGSNPIAREALRSAGVTLS